MEEGIGGGEAPVSSVSSLCPAALVFLLARRPKSISRQTRYRKNRVSRSSSLHEDYRDDGPTEIGSDRAFGYTVGAILMVIGAAKAVIAGAVTPASYLLFGVGAVLLVLGIVAPRRLSVLNRVWLRIGALLAAVVNPIVLMLLFLLVVTPMAFFMRLLGKRPLRLAPDPSAGSYWIKREPQSGSSTMRQQF